jgi:hypothetical protein
MLSFGRDNVINIADRLTDRWTDNSTRAWQLTTRIASQKIFTQRSRQLLIYSMSVTLNPRPSLCATLAAPIYIYIYIYSCTIYMHLWQQCRRNSRNSYSAVSRGVAYFLSNEYRLRKKPLILDVIIFSIQQFSRRFAATGHCLCLAHILPLQTNAV